jgi:hypothetical protein
MGYGFKATNQDTGGVAVDDTYRNLMLRGVYNLTTDSPNKANYATFTEYPKNGYSYAGVPASDPAVAPLMFFPADVYMGAASQGWLVANKARGSAVKVALFDVPLTPVAPLGHGTLTRTAAGDVAYYSGYRYLKVHQVISGSDYVATPINVSLDPAKKWAFCSFKWSGRWRMDDDRAYDSIGSNLRFYRVRREILGLRLSAGSLTSIDMSYMDDSDYAMPDSASDHYESLDRSYAVLIADMTHIAEW